MLSDYGIENSRTKVADKGKDIFEIETPFVAHFGELQDRRFAAFYEINYCRKIN
jgi:hypothetical protein